MTVIRVARVDDVPVILSMIRELADYEHAAEQVAATEGSLRTALFAETPAVFCHLAEHEGEPAGFALWFLNFSTWIGHHGIYLEDLYVRPRLRRYGYGRALLTELARLAIERGYGRIDWSVLEWNEKAMDFYRSLGAAAMDDWTVYRLTGSPLRGLATGESTDSEALGGSANLPAG